MQVGLFDLDELILLCRNEQAKRFIAEAVASYKAGAYRAAIVATWIAVAYDIIAKLRELALTGDKQAEKEVEAFERIRATADVVNALRFERGLLAMARDNFELVSPVEFTDLLRLQEDRNRCAHPSMNSSDESYTPTAELARFHLRNAVTAVLERPPVQGKAALERLLSEIASPYFPRDKDKAIAIFEHGPLARPRESLVRNLVIVLTKEMLDQDLVFQDFARRATAVNAVEAMHPNPVAIAFSERLSDLSRKVSDEELKRVVRFLWLVNDTWQYLAPDVRHILVNYVESIPTGDFGDIDEPLAVHPLRAAAVTRISRATEDEVFFTAPAFLFSIPELNDRRIALYLLSRNWNQANRRAKELVHYISTFTLPQVEHLIAGAGANEEISGSFEISTIIGAIQRSGIIDEERLDKLLLENGLGETAR